MRSILQRYSNWISDQFLGFVVNLISYFQLRKSIVQTTLKGRAFPIFIGTSPIITHYIRFVHWFAWGFRLLWDPLEKISFLMAVVSYDTSSLDPEFRVSSSVIGTTIGWLFSLGNQFLSYIRARVCGIPESGVTFSLMGCLPPHAGGFGIFCHWVIVSIRKLALHYLTCAKRPPIWASPITKLL